MAKKLYAAYGSNINLEQMAYRCPHSTVAGTAMLKGYELQFRHQPRLNRMRKVKFLCFYGSLIRRMKNF